MALIVQKYGGTSVSDAERIRAVAGRVVEAAERGDRVCVVVSAMGDTTDELLELAASVARLPHPRELDRLLSAGERISMALLAMAVNELGREAVSLSGRQAGVVTDTRHGNARIVDVRAQRLHETLERGVIAIVAGFQGVSPDEDETTLGRGGSDMTAVALAAALGADACEINTDVAGVFTADPRIVPEARLLRSIAYDEMLELAASGAGVLMTRSVEVARTHGVPINVRSSWSDGEGTWVRQQEDGVERPIISGIAHDRSVAKIVIWGVPDRPGIAARVFRPLAEAGVNIDMIVQNVSAEGRTDISFTVPSVDLARAGSIVDDIREAVGAEGALCEDDIGTVSLVGAGLRTHPEVTAELFAALADAEINIEIISTSPIRISCVVRRAELDRAVQHIHRRFRLDEEAIHEAVTPPSAPRGAS
ncbi:MAG: aspartate kinase [Chloroflexota bacterium]|nr:aspartate kinase [Chloroflexota bacterium]